MIEQARMLLVKGGVIVNRNNSLFQTAINYYGCSNFLYKFFLSFFCSSVLAFALMVWMSVPCLLDLDVGLTKCMNCP